MEPSSREPGVLPLPCPGDLVLASFRLLRQIGAGSFATAYLAEQLGTERRAVVKIPHPHLLLGPHGPELRRRFEAEARAATRAKHPNLVTVYVVGETQYGVPAIAMEHVAGESLHDRLSRSAPLAVPELVAVGTQLADALATLHAAGIVHRDLSPANVLLQASEGPPSIKLLDFGVAKLLDAPSRTLGPLGTPGYLAPEQLLGQVTPQADVYSLGAVLWWALTGCERPDDFSDGSLRASIGARVGPDPLALRPTAPAALAAIVRRALIPEPSLRPSMPELLLAWRAAADERAVTLPMLGTGLGGGRRRSLTPPGSTAFAGDSSHAWTLPDHPPGPPPSRRSRTSTADPSPRLRPGLIAARLSAAPTQLAASLDAFIGSVPEWLARVDAALTVAERSRAATTTPRAQPRELARLITSADAIGADHLARLARAVADSLAQADLGSARVFLAAAEREYIDVFQEAFCLLDQISPEDPRP